MKLSKPEIIIIAIATVMVALGFTIGRMTAPVVIKAPIDFDAPYKHREDSMKMLMQQRNNYIHQLEDKHITDSINTQKRYHEIFNFTPLARNKWRDSVAIRNGLR